MRKLLLLPRIALVATVGGSILLGGSPAHAQVTPEEGLRQLDTSRRLVAESVELYEAGRAEDAYLAARNAYLDHFEFVEIPLRVRDERLTLELEEDFAELRNLIQSGAPVDEVEGVARTVQSGLDHVQKVLTAPGLGAPAIAATYSFTILFREGLEAVLVLAAILGYLEASRNHAYRKPVLAGVGAAVVASILTFVVASVILSVAPVQRELLEAGTALLAVVLLFYVSFWLVSRLDQRRWMEFVKAKVWSAASTGSMFALGAVGFTAVYREGFETVLFYQALLSFAQELEVWVALGALAGAVALAVVGFAIFRAGKRIPIKAFLTTAVVLVMALSVALIGNAVRAMQEATLVPVTFLEGVPRLPIFLADLAGWHPTLQTILAQAILALIYIAGAIWTFVIRPRRLDRVEPKPPAEVVAVDEPEPETQTTS
ncbi:MAG TPA: FTR1 family protein [Actinomycetota bacterium]|nr:FTR1 family protein [Actinomycetota bacterium]